METTFKTIKYGVGIDMGKDEFPACRPNVAYFAKLDLRGRFACQLFSEKQNCFAL